MKTLEYFAMVFAAASIIFLPAACSSDEEGALEDNYWHSIIVTPNGRRGVYCAGLRSQGRTDCYRFVSKNCPGGYTFIRDADNSAMLECKKQEPGQ